MSSNIDNSNSINDNDKTTEKPNDIINDNSTSSNDVKKTATLQQLFSEADSYDILLMTIGTIGALGIIIIIIILSSSSSSSSSS